MKRVCNEQERQIIIENWDCLLTATLKKDTRSSVMQIMGSYFIGIMIALVGLFVLADLGVPVWLAWVWFLFFALVPPIFLYMIFKVVKRNRDAKNFLKKDRLQVNGATLVAIDLKRRMFSYIEDDMKDENGNPIVWEYPALSIELLKGIGNRLLVMYENESSFQLMAVNRALQSLIPAEPGVDLNHVDWSKCKYLPHPNALHLAYEEQRLSDVEKEKFAKLHVKYIKSELYKTIKFLSVFFFMGVMLLCIVFGILEENSLVKYIIYGLLGCVAYVVFFLSMPVVFRKHLKQQATFEIVKEVVYHSYGRSRETGMIVGKVYEWTGNEFEIVPYQVGILSPETPYGTVLYKCTNRKGKVLFFPKKEESKSGT